MRIDTETPAIFVDVKLTGKKGTCVVNAALDTGSTFSIISWKTAESLGYNPASIKERVSITTASGVEIIPLVTIEAIEALDVRKEKAKVGCHVLPPQATVNALLGLDFLRKLVTKIDLKEGILEFQDP